MPSKIIPNVRLLDFTENPEKKIVQIAHLSRHEQYKEDIDSEAISKFFNIWINKHNHLSVLEHAHASFLIEGGSRNFTHQLVRHRLASFLQQSQRMIKADSFNYIIPPDIENNPEAVKIFNDFMDYSQNIYNKLVKLVKPEDARFVLPSAVESKIIFSANFREFRHVFKLRGTLHAQWEIRNIVIQMWKELINISPNAFKCFILNNKDGEEYLKFESE